MPRVVFVLGRARVHPLTHTQTHTHTHTNTHAISDSKPTHKWLVYVRACALSCVSVFPTRDFYLRSMRDEFCAIMAVRACDCTHGHSSATVACTITTCRNRNNVVREFQARATTIHTIRNNNNSSTYMKKKPKLSQGQSVNNLLVCYS